MSSFYSVHALPGGRIVRLTRTGQEFLSDVELVQERFRVTAELDKIGRAGRALLIDSRLAPSTTERWSQEFAQLRVSVVRGWTRVASIVQTKAGVLQANRLCADDPVTSSVQVFDSEQMALAYLQNPSSPSFSAVRRPSSVPVPRRPSGTARPANGR